MWPEALCFEEFRALKHTIISTMPYTKAVILNLWVATPCWGGCHLADTDITVHNSSRVTVMK